MQYVQGGPLPQGQAYYQPQFLQQQQQPQPPQTVLVQGGFDSGARFGGAATGNIPVSTSPMSLI